MSWLDEIVGASLSGCPFCPPDRGRPQRDAPTELGPLLKVIDDLGEKVGSVSWAIVALPD